jgi:hypothetical protein
MDEIMHPFAAEDHIAEKVIEMADRVNVMDLACPGTEAKWAFEMDDVEYEVIVKVVKRLT